jgi:peptidoglycan/LPS O-acetylase OafA/YrhL
MSLILNEKYINQNNSYKLFITNRLLRLYPLYWTVLLLTLSYALLVAIFFNGQHWGRLTPFHQYSDSLGIGSLCFLIFTNVFMFFQDIVMFLGLDLNTGSLFFTENCNASHPPVYSFLLIPPAWTVGLELTFYLIAPFLVRRNLKFIFSLIVVSLLLRAYFYQKGLTFDPWTYRFFPFELVFFLLGNLSYRIYKKIQEHTIGTLYLNSALIFIVLFTLFFQWIEVPYKAYIYFICFFCLIPLVFLRTKKWKMDTFIGELSYPVYISHIFVLSIISKISVSFWGGKGIALVITSILFSILLNEVIAKRIEKVRQMRVASPVA